MERVSRFFSFGEGAGIAAHVFFSRIRRTARAILAFSLIPSLGLSLFAQAPTVPRYQIGDTAVADFSTPVPLTVLNPEETAALREQEARKAPAVFRFRPEAGTEADRAMHAAFANKREAFLAALETASRRRVLEDTTVTHASFQRFVTWFQNKHPGFPLSSNLARTWALGENDGAILGEWTARLRQAMGGFICSDSSADAMNATAATQVQILSVTHSNTVDLQSVERWATSLAKTNLQTLVQARSAFPEGFSAQQEPVAKFLADFLKQNCSLDEALSAQLRAKRMAEVVAVESYGAGQTIVRSGQVVDARAKAALDLLRAESETEPERGANALQKLDAARLMAEALMERAARFWVRVRTEDLSYVAMAAVTLVLILVSWRILKKRPPALASSTRVIGAEAGYAMILNRDRHENFLPAKAVLNPANVPPEPLQTIAPVQSGIIDAHQSWQEKVLAAEKRAEQLLAMVREGLAPHLARELMNKLVRELISQRAGLIHTQQMAECQLSSMEARFEKVIVDLQERLAVHEKRTAQLEKELAAKKEENIELLKASITSTRTKLEADQSTKGVALN